MDKTKQIETDKRLEKQDLQGLKPSELCRLEVRIIDRLNFKLSDMVGSVDNDIMAIHLASDNLKTIEEYMKGE